jgi:hypothetical protein
MDNRHRLEKACGELVSGLSDGLRRFLECPEAFVGLDGRKHPYVSAVPVRWDTQESRFVADLLDTPKPVLFHEDGKLYFGLGVFLESGEGVFPKKPFVTLLSAATSGDDIRVRLEDTGLSVHLGDMNAREDLYGEICGVIEDALDWPTGRDATRPKIGFVDLGPVSDKNGKPGGVLS